VFLKYQTKMYSQRMQMNIKLWKWTKTPWRDVLTVASKLASLHVHNRVHNRIGAGIFMNYLKLNVFLYISFVRCLTCSVLFDVFVVVLLRVGVGCCTDVLLRGVGSVPVSRGCCVHCGLVDVWWVVKVSVQHIFVSTLCTPLIIDLSIMWHEVHHAIM